MRRNRLNAYRTPDQRHRLGVRIPAAITLLLVLALTADVWALSSGGRYGGRGLRTPDHPRDRRPGG